MNAKKTPGAAADGRLDQLLDEELREMAQARAVDLRAKVMEAIEGGRPTRTEAPAWRLVPAWTFGAAAAAVILVALFVSWPGWGKLERARHNQEEQKLAAGQERVAGHGQQEQGGSIQQGQVDRHTSSEAGRSRPSEPSSRQMELARHRRVMASRRSNLGSLQAPTEDSALQPLMPRIEAMTARAAVEPYLPGAPAGDLGDPLAPLPPPPAISMAPIAPAPILVAPPVSESARPVTNFPVADAPPDAPSRATGESGGMRR